MLIGLLRLRSVLSQSNLWKLLWNQAGCICLKYQFDAERESGPCLAASGHHRRDTRRGVSLVELEPSVLVYSDIALTAERPHSGHESGEPPYSERSPSRRQL